MWVRKKLAKWVKRLLNKCVELSEQHQREEIQKKYNLSSTISFGDISLEGNVVIGENTYINDYTRIDTGNNSMIQIGRNCAIGRFVHITSKTHSFVQPTRDEDTNEIELLEADVKIGNQVWIGDKVTVLPGVEIGDYAIIGAHSLVNKNVKPFEIVGGVPAKHIRFNSKNRKYPDGFTQ